MGKEKSETGQTKSAQTSTTAGKIFALFGKAGLTLMYIGVLAAAGSLLLSMFGPLFTLDIDAAIEGVEFFLIGIFVQAPFLGIGTGIVVIVALVATIPLHKQDFGSIWTITLAAAFGVGLIWCVVIIFLTGMEMSFWPGLVGGILGGLAGLAAGLSGYFEDDGKGKKTAKRRAGKRTKRQDDTDADAMPHGDDGDGGGD